MTTTRQLVNHRRRVAAATTATPPAPGSTPGSAPATDAEESPRSRAPRRVTTPKPVAPEDEARPRRRLLTRRSLPGVLGLATVLLGAVAAWSGVSAHSLDADASRSNTALSDAAGTSQVSGQLTSAVNALFSYSYVSPATTQAAAAKDLTGAAVKQYATLLAPVRSVAAKEKLVLTTTVTNAGVELLHGDTARVLVYADQRSTRGDTGATTYGAAMLAVDAVRQGGTWRISGIDTYS